MNEAVVRARDLHKEFHANLESIIWMTLERLGEMGAIMDSGLKETMKYEDIAALVQQQVDLKQRIN